MTDELLTKFDARRPGICLYGLVPPKRETPADRLRTIAEHQAERLERMELDGVIVYDVGDESDRIDAPRPFPFFPIMEPEDYAYHHLARVELPRIVYRRVSRDTPESFVHWLSERPLPEISVLVGAPTRTSELALPLTLAYKLAREHAPGHMLGGIAIAERHAHRYDEHERIIAKTVQGCRFFVTQAVYDLTSTKSLLSDYALAVEEPVPIILTFAPCGSPKTLEFMRWLGISFPRWLENELRSAPDPLATSMKLCEEIFADVWTYAAEKGVPVGVNVESVSIRKDEIEASIELARRLRKLMG